MNDFFDEEYNKNFKRDDSYNNPPPAPKNKKIGSKILTVFACLICAVFIFTCGMLVGRTNKTAKSGIIDTVLQEVKSGSIYYDANNWDAIVDQMITNAGTAMLQTIDGYGMLLSPAQMYDLMNPTESQSPTFGVSFIKTQIGYYVAHVYYGSGAYKSGLQNGDLVVTVARDGYTTVDLRTAKESAISEILNGDWNTTVKFTYIRGLMGATSTDDLTLNTAEVKKIRYENNFVDYYFGAANTDITDATLKTKLNLASLDGTNIGYIRINSFETLSYLDDNGMTQSTSASKEFETAMEKFKQVYGGNGKLLLDLTGNPGGYVDEATKIASYLIYDFANPTKTDYLVTTLDGRLRESKEKYKTKSVFNQYFDVNQAATKKPIVVLTDENSASASELLLGALLDYGTCTHVGATSFGKGIAQTCYPLNYTGDFYYTDMQGNITKKTYYYGLYFTIAKYYTPKGSNIHGIGFTPKEENKVNPSDYTAMFARAKTLLG